MKLILDIFRWLVALFASFIWYILVISVVPVFLFLGTLGTRTGAMQFVQTITSTDKATESFREGLLTSFAQNEALDADLRQMAVKLADPTTTEGKTIRSILTPAMIRENLVRNTTILFDWEEGKTADLVFVFKLAGTQAQHEQILSDYFKAQYANLPQCTASDLESARNATDPSDIPQCQYVPPAQYNTTSLVKQFTSAPEYKQAITTGLPMETKANESDRQAFAAMTQLSKTGMVAFWIILGIGALIIWLLFTPRAVSTIVTGLLFLVSGLTLYSENVMVKAITQANLGSITDSLNKTATSLTILGVGLIVLGIFIAIAKRKKTVVTTPAVPTTTTTSTTTVPATVPATPVAATSTETTSTAQPTIPVPAATEPPKTSTTEAAKTEETKVEKAPVEEPTKKDVPEKKVVVKKSKTEKK